MRRLLATGFVTGTLLSAAPSFVRDIWPILQKQCAGCHQPASKTSGLDLTGYSSLAKGGNRGPAYKAESPADSLVRKYIAGSVQPRMPIGGAPLSADQINFY